MKPQIVPAIRPAQGFTLIELIIVIVILGILAATALPKFIDMRTDARLARVQNMAGELKSVANMVRAKCIVTPSCGPSNPATTININGTTIAVNYGWPDSGDNIGNNEIDRLVNTTGWTVSLPSGYVTKFALDGAADPANCAVTYTDAYSNPTGIAISTIISGC